MANAIAKLIQLNVGGTVFKTTPATLTKYGRFFKNSLNKIPISNEGTGEMFIKRSPKHFSTILNFIHDDDAVIPESKEIRREIQKEAEFYDIQNLAMMCRMNQEGPRIRFVQDFDAARTAFQMSWKKGFIHVSYSKKGRANPTKQMAKIVERYSDVFEIFFSPDPERIGLPSDEWMCRFLFPPARRQIVDEEPNFGLSFSDGTEEIKTCPLSELEKSFDDCLREQWVHNLFRMKVESAERMLRERS